MKIRTLLTLILFMSILNAPINATAQEPSAEPFLGMWALDLDYESNNAGWLEVTGEDGYLDGSILWRWGSVYQVGFVFTMMDELFLTSSRRLVREKDEQGEVTREHQLIWWFQVKKEGPDNISGTAVFPHPNGSGVESVNFTGKRIPPYGERPKPKKAEYGDEIRLFNGRNLDGWELLNKSAANGWKVVDGVLVNDPVQKEGEPHIHYGNLRTTESFGDFNLKLEVNVPTGSNSGVYLRGIYEVQVFDSYGKELDSHHMGALYSRITPSESAEKPAGEWQSMDITLYRRHLTVILNGKTIIDNQPVRGVTGGALTSDEFSPGPIYLQGDHGQVSYRNIRLTPIIE